MRRIVAGDHLVGNHTHRGQRNLGDDEQLKWTQAAASAAERTRLHHVGEVRARRVPRRIRPECEPGQDGDHHREAEQARIDLHGGHHIAERLGYQRGQRSGDPYRERDAEDSAGNREQQALGQELADLSNPAGAQGRTYAEFAPACRASREQEEEAAANVS